MPALPISRQPHLCRTGELSKEQAAGGCVGVNGC